MGIDELHTSWLNTTEWRMGKWRQLHLKENTILLMLICLIHTLIVYSILKSLFFIIIPQINQVA